MAEQQLQHQKAVLQMEIGLASTQSVRHQWGYCCVCFHSRGGRGLK